MPVEETEDYIHVRILDPEPFDECRLTDFDEKLPEGVRAKYCRYKDRDEWAIQAYLFSKLQWTRERALEWAQRHEAGIQLEYFAAVKDFEERDGRHYARIYLINTDLNRNNWRVTEEALDPALNTLLGKPLTARPGYRLNHVAKPLSVGAFVQVDKPDGHALGVAEITDPMAWKKIESKEWGPVSVEITAHKVTCSKCGRDVLSEPDEHIRSREGHEVIHDFTFDRVAFVAEPAYPRAGILVFNGLEQCGFPNARSALTEKKEGGRLASVEKRAGVIPFEEARKAPEDEAWDFNAAEYDVDQLRRASTWYDSEKPDVKESYKLPHHRPDGTLVWHGVTSAMQVLLGARGGVEIPQEDRQGVYNHLTKHYAQFDKEPPEYHASDRDQGNPLSPEKPRSPGSEKTGEKSEMSEKIAQLEKQLEAVTAENKALKTKLDKIEEERHLERVAELVDIRIQAGLAKDREAEIQRYKGFDEGTLALMREDVQTLTAEKEKIAKLAGPKAKYTAQQEDQVKAKVEELRLQWFGHTGTLGTKGGS